ncbi:MAG: phosphotyrosine protein phosphatase [Micavibrio sp.]|nr:phosphotyrosine protein phosphatase [Micavibrio sp.]
MRHHAKGLDIETDSAAIQGYHIGDAPDPRTIAMAKTRGYDLTPLRARKVKLDDFNTYDLILAMDKGHHEALIAMAPPASRAELALFLDYTKDSGYEEVPDPYYGEERDFEIVLDLVERGVTGLIGTLR